MKKQYSKMNNRFSQNLIITVTFVRRSSSTCGTVVNACRSYVLLVVACVFHISTGRSLTCHFFPLRPSPLFRLEGVTFS
jgi:hypothetical protein